jgi:transposase/IS5 family transposase
MAHISGHDRSQTLLFPEAVDDYVGPDNPVRFIDAFVDGLDLAAAGFVGVEPKATGRPGYAPADLLKLYIYGYLNRIRSSRRLEAETHRNIEVIWLLRHLKPDFKTIADFRHDNRAAFKPVFREFVLLCRQLDLFGRELLAVDGTRIKAVNNKDRNFTRASLAQFIRASDERLADYLRQMDAGDVTEGGTGGGSRVPNLAEKIEAIRAKRDRLTSLLESLDRSGDSQISLTDPDSRAMAAHTRVAVGYNAQIAVDAKHKLIVEQAVTNQVVDLGLLTQTAAPAKEILGVERIDVVADRGYFKFEDIEACEQAGMTPYVPKPQRGPSVREGFFAKDEFRYDPAEDVYVCPAGERLRRKYESKSRELTKIDYSNRSACLACTLRPRCTNTFRRVSRLENEAVLDRMAARLKARPEIVDSRRETVEHPVGSIKQWMGQGAFLMKGLENVRAEFSLTALAYNLRRALNLLGVRIMIAAVGGG